MIITLMISVFILGYIAIALEHPLKIDKAATALLIGGICWGLFAFLGNGLEFQELLKQGGDLNWHDFVKQEIHHHIIHISEILFFLLGAMTIVELIDAHQGFYIITKRITTTSKVKLMWILSFITFFFSAALDNLTTAIVMATLLSKLIKDKEDRWMFAGLVILAANAGGAWSPIGDITTIMLWINGQVTVNIISAIIIPSLVCAIVPLIYLSFRLKGHIQKADNIQLKEHYVNPTTSFERNLIFYTGLAGLLFVPVFKIVTHLPPYIGMLLSLGVLWIITEIIHRSKNHEEKSKLSVISVLKKIDTPTIFFFLGILLAVSALQSAGQLKLVAEFLDNTFSGDIYIINIIIGLLSSIVDNVPLVAGAIGMYEIAPAGDFAVDGKFWEFLAYCAGTGGSVLVIGSAAGVAVMGIQKIDFIWYVKNIAFLALIGYFSGAAVYILMQ